MESNWRIVALGGLLLILWIWENLSPLRTNDRKHLSPAATSSLMSMPFSTKKAKTAGLAKKTTRVNELFTNWFDKVNHP
jgi:hypothetical protein